MFTLIILAGYLLMIAIFTIIALFIAYHLASYTLNSSSKHFILAFFLLISTGLLLSNLLLFFSVDWNRIISQLTNF
jgi:hypothetical protein